MEVYALPSALMMFSRFWLCSRIACSEMERSMTNPIQISTNSAIVAPTIIVRVPNTTSSGKKT